MLSDYYSALRSDLRTTLRSDPNLLRDILLLISAAASLILIYYYVKDSGGRYLIAQLQWLGLSDSAGQLKQWLYQAEDESLHRLGYKTLVFFSAYFVLPALFIKGLFRRRLADYGWCLPSEGRSLRIYLYLYLAVLPLLWFASLTAPFQHTYPFYLPPNGEGLWPRFWIWQGMYLLTFVGLEFFFRGYMTHGLKHRFGYFAVLFMVIPYCMIHFGKPMAESFAAIFAGLILGVLSLKSGSVLPGIALHYAVALSMDLLSLYQRGLLG